MNGGRAGENFCANREKTADPSASLGMTKERVVERKGPLSRDSSVARSAGSLRHRQPPFHRRHRPMYALAEHGARSISFWFIRSRRSVSESLGYDWDDLKRETEMKVAIFALLGVLSIALYSQQSQPTRVGMIIGVKPDKISAYEALHAASNQGVRDLLDKYHMHNFSIYIHKMDETHYYLFAYYEYTGNNYKQDMDTMAKEPRNIAWLSKTDAMQIPFAGQKSWTKM